MLGVVWLVDPLVDVVMLSSSSDVQDALAFCNVIWIFVWDFCLVFVHLRISFLKY